MKHAIFAVAVTLALAVPACAQPPQPLSDAGHAIANQIGTLFIQNAALTDQVERQQAVIAGLQKQLADAKTAVPAPKPNDAKADAPPVKTDETKE